MELVTIENNEIRLNSFMNEMAFGKTNYDSIISQAGILATCDGISGEKYHFSFEPWCFSEIKAFDTAESPDRIVFYCGKNPLAENAKSLLNLFEASEKSTASEEEKEACFMAAYMICSIYTQAAVEGIELPVNGGGGILIDLDKANPKILFLPPKLFKYSSGGLNSVTSANLHGYWVNSTLFDLPSLCFARAVIVYKMISGRFPYPAADATERNADILDRKFLPLELCIKNVDSVLATEVNRALKLNSNEVAIPGKKKKGKSSEDLTPTPTFPLDLLYKSKDQILKSREESYNDSELQEKAKTFLKNQNSKVNAKRKIRRNITAIVAVLISIVVLSFFIATSVKNGRDNYTSIGLTSTQTIEGYFKATNTRDTVLMSNMVKGKNPSRYVDAVSRVYVIGKQRQTYSHDMGYISPENWMYFTTDIDKLNLSGIYGITNLKIDGKPSDFNPTLYKKNEKPEVLKQENGINLENNAKSVHNVEYFLIHSEGEAADMVIDRVFETFTLTFIKNQWRITKIETSTYETDFNSFAFKSDYFGTLKKYDGDVLKTARELRSKYQWLPTEAVLKQEKIRFEEERNSAFKALGF